MSLRQETISGIGWTATARVINQGISFILSIFLMRLLDPEAFGLIGMAMVFIGFADIFKEFGFGSAIVQRSHLAESHYSSTFYLNIVAGAILTALFVVTAPLLSQFYGDPNLTKVLQVLSVNFLVAGIGIVPRSVLQRNMQFDVLSKIGISASVCSGIVGVLLAFWSFGVWALVFQSLLGTLIGTTLYLTFVGWTPKWQFSFRSIKHLWAYSANLTGFNVVNYWARNTDDLLIGKFMGSYSLGLYTRAYTLMLLPINHIISIVSGVMFSALSKIQRQKERVKKAYLKAMQLLAFITFPMMIGLFVVAEPFVIALFGQKWSGAIPLIQILTWVGIIQTLCNPTGWIYTSQGKTKWMFWWGVFGGSTLIVAIVIGVWMGSVESVAIAYGIGNLVITYPCIAIPGKLIDMKFMEVIKRIYPSLFNSLFMAGVVWLISLVLPESLLVQLKLLLLILTGMISYISVAYLARMSAYEELKSMIIDQGFYFRK